MADSSKALLKVSHSIDFTCLFLSVQAKTFQHLTNLHVLINEQRKTINCKFDRYIMRLI